MKYHSKCINQEDKPVALMVRAESVVEAEEKLFEMYKVKEVIEIKPYENYRAKRLGEAVMGAPTSYKRQKNEKNFRKGYARAKILK